ncbi:MAG: GDP-mannose 4,6-dehydratase [Anaerolineae bacterium]|nr:GDP-mannose 4,6-dehydratase [Anaerolineae bacterium]
MKALITGANGFVGTHLVDYLSAHTDLELFGAIITPPSEEVRLKKYAIHLHQVDFREEAEVKNLLLQIRPELIFHLAAQAFVPASFKDPWGTLENNIKGQVNLFQNLLSLELDARVLIVSSAEVYGAIRPEENPVNENQPFRPANPYSVSKVAQDMLAYQYFIAYGMKTFRARAFNHIGPGQDIRFALADFASQIAAIEKGQRDPVIRVGNLDAQRDFTDVRDVVRAYYQIVTQGKVGEVYNVCRGEAHSLRELLDMLCGMSTARLRVEIDPTRLRPLDVECVIGDATRLRQDTGWQPTIDIRQSLTDILDTSRREL